jgi:RNA polymerase sigma-70 factor (ECF subfamily)
MTAALDAPSTRHTDGSLLKRYQSGADAAATDIYLRYAPRLRALAARGWTPNYGGRLDEDDVVQSVFRAFFHGARNRAYEVPPDGELWGLLMVLALNKVRSLVGFHQAGKRAVRNTALVSDLDAHPTLAADDSAAAFLRMIMDEQVAALPESNRAIIRLSTEGCVVNSDRDPTPAAPAPVAVVHVQRQFDGGANGLLLQLLSAPRATRPCRPLLLARFRDEVLLHEALVQRDAEAGAVGHLHPAVHGLELLVR